MSRRVLGRLPLPPLRHDIGLRRNLADQAEVKVKSSIERIESRLPRFLHRFTYPLRTAPVSHITAFVILHELTAIVPLFGLAGIFYFTNWRPPYISEGYWVQKGTEMFGNWLRKKGWIDSKEDRRSKWFGRSEQSVNAVVSLATAYAITKVLLPVRIPLSIWLTPWFARWTVLPVRNGMRRIFWKSKQKKLATVTTDAPSKITQQQHVK